jgi:hypothetical protein
MNDAFEALVLAYLVTFVAAIAVVLVSALFTRSEHNG